MLLYWLQLALRRVIWLFKYPTSVQLARVDSNARCPACGNCSGSIRTVLRPTAGAWHLLIEHSCSICAAQWNEKPVCDHTKVPFYCGPPRNEYESKTEQAHTLKRSA